VQIGVISDTHGVLHPKVPEFFQKVEAILHAGDIGDAAVLRQLESIASVHAISGNADSPPLADLPQEKVLLLAGRRILLCHRAVEKNRVLPEVRRTIEIEQPEAVVFGHSHIPFSQILDGTFFFNPGGGGRKRFTLPRAVGILTLEKGKDIRGQHYYLDA
jgi:hypothetical protein